MTEPDWAVVLDSLYNTNGFLFRPKGGDVMEADIQDSQNVYHQIPLPTSDLVEALSLGRRMGLWEEEREMVQDEKDDMNASVIKLTEKGFDVAHERELRKEQQDLIESQNDATGTLADFTIILGVTAVIQALAAVVSVPRFNIFLGFFYLALIGLLWYKREDWFHNR